MRGVFQGNYSWRIVLPKECEEPERKQTSIQTRSCTLSKEIVDQWQCLDCKVSIYLSQIHLFCFVHSDNLDKFTVPATNIAPVSWMGCIDVLEMMLELQEAHWQMASTQGADHQLEWRHGWPFGILYPWGGNVSKRHSFLEQVPCGKGHDRDFWHIFALYERKCSSGNIGADDITGIPSSEIQETGFKVLSFSIKNTTNKAQSWFY